MEQFLNQWKNYSEDIPREVFLKERELFFKHTLKEDYKEERLDNFLDWILIKYMKNFSLPVTVQESLKKSKHSLFEYKKKFLSKKNLTDLVTQEKYILSPPHPLLMQGDVFSGRLVEFNQEYFILPGILSFPKEIKPFLYKTRLSTLEWEHLLDKSKHYQHLSFKEFLSKFYPWVF